jgi:hypothetical protein
MTTRPLDYKADTQPCGEKVNTKAKLLEMIYTCNHYVVEVI